MMRRTKVFISYSHEELSWLKSLQTHLKPLAREGLIDLWDDTRIKTGSNWQHELAAALATADVAILLVSAPFLASDFISTKELPALLTAAKARGTLILPIIVSACGFERTELQQFRAFNSPDKPLNKMTKANRDRLFKEVADRVSEAVLPEPDASFPENSEQDNLDSVSARPRRKTPIGPADLPRNSAELPAGKIPGRRKHFVMAVLTGHPVE